MTETIHVEVQGLDKLQAALRRFPQQSQRYLQAAGEEAGKDLLKVEGLQKYPPETAANMPPTPYYIRGRGTEYGYGNKGNSERLGTQWYTKPALPYGTEIGNRASYAPYVHGDEQARAMARIGWRKLFDVAMERLPQITKVYQKWVDKLLHDIGLK